MKIHIPYEFPNWNEYINAERSNRYIASDMKKVDKEAVIWLVKEKYQGSYPVTLTIRPYFKHKKKDLDNYRIKGLLDGLVSAGVIENDNLTKIDKIILEPVFTDEVGVDVIIEPTEHKKDELREFIESLSDEDIDILKSKLTEYFDN
jgi:Holliday junction resolvase RusA-like endonuclease